MIMKSPTSKNWYRRMPATTRAIPSSGAFHDGSSGSSGSGKTYFIVGLSEDAAKADDVTSAKPA
jgi:hypothetical protein